MSGHTINLCDMNAKYAAGVKTAEALAFLDSLPAGMFELPKGAAGWRIRVSRLKAGTRGRDGCCAASTPPAELAFRPRAAISPPRCSFRSQGRFHERHSS